jgi:hypothetical protein
VHTEIWWGNLSAKKKSLGRARRRWEDNTKIGLEEIEWGHGMD